MATEIEQEFKAKELLLESERRNRLLKTARKGRWWYPGLLVMLLLFIPAIVLGPSDKALYTTVYLMPVIWLVICIKIQMDERMNALIELMGEDNLLKNRPTGKSESKIL